MTFRNDWEKKCVITQSEKPAYTLNNARVQVECRCRVTDLGSLVEREYVLGASSKSERVGVPSGLWMQPNADFAPVFSRDEYLLMKSWDRNDKGVLLYPPSLGVQGERRSGLVSETYDEVRLDIRETDGEILTDSRRIILTTLNNAALVAITEYKTLEHIIRLEYPVKTMNANERDWIYQADTGPVVFPDSGGAPGLFASRFRLAWIAFNAPGWAEFIVQVPTPLNSDISVHHYSHSAAVKAANTVVRVGP